MSTAGTYGDYDASLQMYLEDAGPIDLDTLNFIKWLVDTERLAGDTIPVEEN